MNISIPHWIVCHSRPSTAVGYQNKEGQVNNFNFVTPTFRDIGGGELVFNILDLQMESSVGLGGATFSTLDNSNLRKAQVDYVWVPKASYSACKIVGYNDRDGVWAATSGSGKKTTYTVPTGDAQYLKVGTGIQLYINGDGKKLNFAGKVSDAQVAFVSTSNFNFIGYPFPQDGDIRDIQMDSTVGLGGATYSILDNSNLRKAVSEYAWVPKASYSACKVTGRDGDNGTWAIVAGSGKKTTYTVPTGDALILKAGSAIQLYVNGEGKTVYISPSYELK